MSKDEGSESYSVDLEASSDTAEQRIEPDDEDEIESGVVDEDEEELVGEEGSTSEHGSQTDGAEAAGDGEEEDFYDEEVADEEQQSERADEEQQSERAAAGPPASASHAEQASDSNSQAEADDSYSDDAADDDASPSVQAAAVDRSQVQQETAKYLQMLKSGQLKLPTLENQQQQQQQAPGPAASARSPRHTQLSIRDMVSPSVASNIFSRGSKLLTPGPGAYEPAMDRFGKFYSTAPQQPAAAGAGRSTFGSARQRPRHVCIPHPVASPGPMYLPQKHVSTLADIPHLSFPRQEVGSRFMLSASMPANCPHWNPGPGHYKASTVYKGGVLDPNDAPRYGFPKSTKSPDSVARLTNTRLIYESKANASVSPCSYNPDASMTKPAAKAFSLAEKAPSYFDAFLDPGRHPSPGPVYPAHHLDGRGKRIWGDDPRATFGRSKKEWEPELNLSATCFISNVHAHHSNQTLHSPGPVYFPELAQHARAPLLASGPLDRFYDRFEPGRMI